MRKVTVLITCEMSDANLSRWAHMTSNEWWNGTPIMHAVEHEAEIAAMQSITAGGLGMHMRPRSAMVTIHDQE